MKQNGILRSQNYGRPCKWKYSLAVPVDGIEALDEGFERFGTAVQRHLLLFDQSRGHKPIGQEFYITANEVLVGKLHQEAVADPEPFDEGFQNRFFRSRHCGRRRDLKEETNEVSKRRHL